MNTATDSTEEKTIVLPSFGFLSAFYTAATFIPHALFILGVIFFRKGQDPFLFFLLFTIMARLFGEWIFWTKSFPQEMDTEENDKNWRSSVRSILTSQPPAIRAKNDIVIDTIVDGVLLFFALKSAASPMWVLFVYSICQGVGGLFQGVLIRIVDRQYVRKFSMIVTALATFMVLEASGVTSIGYIKMLGLSQFSVSSQILFVIGAKCLLAATAVIAKEIIAETLKIKTMKKLRV